MCKWGEDLPDPFPIPLFCLTSEENLCNKILMYTDRKYVVQTLATVLITYIQGPSTSHCGIVPRALAKKYAFLKNDEGVGEVRISTMWLSKYCLLLLN